MTRRFNPPPGWPVPPAGWQPDPGWRPDTSWPAAPFGWNFFIEDDGGPVSLFGPHLPPTSWGTPRTGQANGAHGPIAGARRAPGSGPVPSDRSPSEQPGRSGRRAWYRRKRLITPIVLLVGFTAVALNRHTALTARPAQASVIPVAAGTRTPEPVPTTAPVPTTTAVPTTVKVTASADPVVKGTRHPRARATERVPLPDATVPGVAPHAPASSTGATTTPRARRSATPAPTSPVVIMTPARTKKKKRPAPRPTPSCDPNYSGACVPIASDVDCAGGSGNGPAYFDGVAKVVGTDIYRLDADGDGWACESS